MPSRGVVFGDVMRANDAWDDRLQAIGESKGLDLEKGGSTLVARAEGEMLSGDLFDDEETHEIAKRLVMNYVGVTEDGPVRMQLVSMAMHAVSVGVLTERQRWDTTDVGPGDGQS